MQLDPQQLEVRDAIMAWYAAWKIKQEKQEFRLGGLAGVGKSFLVSKLLRDGFPPETRVATISGKAANVLRNKGVGQAQTIHSLFYEVEPGSSPPVFHPIPWQAMKESIPLLIVDEASMVPTPIYRDIIRCGFPVLWVGDHGQLPPVGDDAGLMNPELLDASLETIHRQAAGSPIIRFAHAVRTEPTAPKPEPPLLRYMRYADPWAVEAADPANDWQVVVGKNATRAWFNQHAREARGFANPICVGDRMICLRNNTDVGLYNGTMCVVTAIGDDVADRVFVNLTTDGGVEMVGVPIWKGGLGTERLPEEPWPYFFKEQAMPFDYSYAVTAHKMQGSSAQNVVAVLESCWHDDRRRWTYTAATRAEQKLLWVRP